MAISHYTIGYTTKMFTSKKSVEQLVPLMSNVFISTSMVLPFDTIMNHSQSVGGAPLAADGLCIVPTASDR